MRGVALGSFGLACCVGGTVLAADPLPEGDNGIAAGYPGDAGIGGDPDVVYADDFESYGQAADLGTNWDVMFQTDQIRIATEADNVYAGNQALEFTVPQQDGELSNATDKFVSPERDVLFLRFYSKFDPPYDVVGSSHNGASIAAHYFVDGQATPGVPADGTNKFLVNLENWRGEAEVASPGRLNIYVYHPEQRSQWGDHFFPGGDVTPFDPNPFDFGPEFVARPDIIPELDRWYCYEYMVQANTPGQRDGRIAFWLDGALAADFQNLRLRDVDTLTIDRFGVGFHIGSNPNGVQRKWYDNVVAAGAYIGPRFTPGGGDGGSGDGGGDGSGSAGDSAGSASAGDDGGPGSGNADGGGGDGDGAGGDSSGCGCVAARPAHPGWLTAFALLALARRRGLHDRVR